MEIKLTDIPLRAGRSPATVNIEMARQTLSLDFRRRNGALGAYVEFRVIGAKLSITVDTAAADSQPRRFDVDLSGARRVKEATSDQR